MYQWNFVGTEVDPESVEFANQNIKANEYADKISIISVSKEEAGSRRILVNVIPNDKKLFSFSTSTATKLIELLKDLIFACAILLSLTL